MDIKRTINDIVMDETYEPQGQELSYDNIINKLTEARDNNVPINEGIIGALVGGVAGVTIAPVIMKTLCKILGIDERGQVGSLLTSRLVLTALCTKMGWGK